jgi:hypothetical protein
VVLFTGDVEHAFVDEAGEATVELARPADQVIGPELVDGDVDHQSDRPLGWLRLGRCEGWLHYEQRCTAGEHVPQVHRPLLGG